MPLFKSKVKSSTKAALILSNFQIAILLWIYLKIYIHANNSSRQRAKLSNYYAKHTGLQPLALVVGQTYGYPAMQGMGGLYRCSTVC